MGKFRIETKVGRDRLTPRSSAYYQKIHKGRSLGYLKGKTGGSWVARVIEPGKKQAFHKIEVPTDDPQEEYGIALDAAQEWFKLFDAGVQTDYLLQDAISDYLEYLRAEKSGTVHNTARTVLKGIPESLQKTPVHKLTTRQMDKWRTSFLVSSNDSELIRRSQNTSNRRWCDLRACLNRSFQQGYVSDKTNWERIQPYKRVQKGRQVFWNTEEVKQILNASKSLNGDFYNLIKAGLLTGCRIGELRALKVKDFDRANQLLEIQTSKTGYRDMFLSPDAYTFLTKQTIDKHPTAWLLDYKSRQWPEDYHHKLFRKIRKKITIDPESTFYCARHFHISQGLQAGISPELIAKNVGTSPAMIHQFYGKFTRTAQKEAAAAIGAVLGVE